ncbi:GLE1-like protein-domain-containing protein, partial [Parasitella parasitica]
DDDKAFEKELEKQRKSVDDAIALDRKKSEHATAEAKAKAEATAERERLGQEEKAKQEQQAKEEKERKAQALEKQKTVSFVSPQGLEEYKKYYEKIEFYQTTIRPKLQEDVFRKQCFEYKKVIKRSVSQLKLDRGTILEKYNLLHDHLLKIKQQSPEAFECMLNHLAKSILSQVKQEVHATAYAAYFLARFSYLLCSTIPEFIQYLMGRLLKRCPYLIPQYHDDNPSLSHEEIKARLRYVMKNKEKNILETFLEHAEGQKCYVMFYGALCQTLPDPGEPENPFSMKHAWVWLARICNMPPREITPILVLGLLEVSAIRFLQCYPNQTPKLFKLIRETIHPLYPICSSKDNVASIERLRMLLDTYFKTGKPECVPEKIPASKLNHQ